MSADLQHPLWDDGTPVLLGQPVAFSGSDADDERHWEDFVGTVVKIESGEVTAYYDGDEREAILTPGTWHRPEAGA